MDRLRILAGSNALSIIRDEGLRSDRVVMVTGAAGGVGLTTVEPTLATAFLHPQAIADLEAGRLWTESIFAVTPGAAASSIIRPNNSMHSPSSSPQ